MPRKCKNGFTLIEIIFAMGISAFIIMMTFTLLAVAKRFTIDNQGRISSQQESAIWVYTLQKMINNDDFADHYNQSKISFKAFASKLSQLGASSSVSTGSLSNSSFPNGFCAYMNSDYWGDFKIFNDGVLGKMNEIRIYQGKVEKDGEVNFSNEFCFGWGGDHYLVFKKTSENILNDPIFQGTENAEKVNLYFVPTPEFRFNTAGQQELNTQFYTDGQFLAPNIGFITKDQRSGKPYSLGDSWKSVRPIPLETTQHVIKFKEESFAIRDVNDKDIQVPERYRYYYPVEWAFAKKRAGKIARIYFIFPDFSYKFLRGN